FYQDNELEGRALYWYENGSLKSEYNYSNFKLFGKVVIGYSNGNKKSECQYIEGTLDGQCIFWYENGKKKMLADYRNGLKIAESIREWNEDGTEIIQEDNTSVTEQIILKEKVIQTGSRCFSVKTDIALLKEEMQTNTRYEDMQKKQIQLNRLFKEEKDKCTSFKAHANEFRKINSPEDLKALASTNGFEGALLVLDEKNDGLTSDDGFGDSNF
ncbi:MAG: hypothetical protein HQK83_14395, partial [Fibrobacteria bacterium]|nr:hypothetical protein [Fibrobacteria bacterium]